MPTRTPQKVLFNVGNVAWTNMPAALTELFGNVHRRLKIDLTDVDKVRLTGRVSTAGTAAAVIRAEYSTDEAAWATLTPDMAIGDGAGTKATVWGDIPVGARGDVFVRIVGEGGNGVVDPVIGNLMLEAA